MAKSILSQDKLKELLTYDPNTGEFRWINSGPGIRRVVAGWGTDQGYIKIGVNGGEYLAHRLAFLYVYGYMPKHIDHINHIRNDNRIVNLRSVEKRENHLNMKMSKRNTSGITGVSRQGNKWVAAIMVQYKQIIVGLYDSIDDAARARKEAERKYGYHINHGN